MSSKTLKHICEHLVKDLKESPIDFPFNVEEFCRENDEKLEAFQSQNAELIAALERLEKFSSELCEDAGVSKHQPSLDNVRAVLRKVKGEVCE